MVHYIRFLRTPQVELVKKSFLEVSAVVAITTDLGDAYLLDDLELVSRLVSAANPGIIVTEAVVQWKRNSRVVKLALRCPKTVQNKTCVLHVTTSETITDHSSWFVPKILDVWSAEFLLENGSRSEPLVNRRIELSPSISVKSWEETGDSIARHIWDAALGSLMYLQETIRTTVIVSELPSLSSILNNKVKGGLNILELGAGCGIVGIALAQALPNCNVLLTDLEDAQAMLKMNMKHAQPASASTIQHAVLDWDSPLDRTILPKKIDLVVIADCIYNTDSIPPLVQTLKHIYVHSPDCKIFIARKPRHDSEMLFFRLVEDAGINVIETSVLGLPHLETEVDVTAPQVEFYLYAL